MGGGGEEFPEPPLVPTSDHFTDGGADYRRHNPLIRTISRGLCFLPPPSSKVGLSCLCPDDLRRTYAGGVFGPPPSRAEVETAMADLQRLMHGEARTDQLQWLQPIVHPTDSMIMLNPGYARFQNVFSMLQREPTVQNMVVNISSDKAFWDAIMNKKAVQNLQTSTPTEQQKVQLLQSQSTSEESIDIADAILKWILGITKSKIGYLVEKIGVLVAEIFVPGNKQKPTSELTDLVEEKIRPSTLLSVVILLIVVVTRNNGA